MNGVQAALRSQPNDADEMPVAGLWRWLRTLVFFALTVIATGVFVEWLVDPAHSPLSQVQIQGEFKHLDRAALETALAPMLDKGFFNIDVAAIQAQVISRPWVDRATVRRVWPDRLAIHIVEQHPVARWGEGSLLNPRGEVFSPALFKTVETLPLLSGPEGHAAEVLARYQRINDRLKSLGLVVVELHQDARRSWRLILSNGTAVALGRTDTEQRLARFIRVYPSILATASRAVLRVDLRYSNGFALHWADTEDEKTG